MILNRSPVAQLCRQMSASLADCNIADRIYDAADGVLQTQVLQEKARAAGLEVQVRAVCLELASARQLSGAR